MKILIYILLLAIGCKGNQKTQSNIVRLSNNQIDNLKYIAANLKEDIPDYNFKLSYEDGFVIKDEGIVGVNIYDLNIGESTKANFKNGHVYHISPINFQNSYSYILCVFDNNMLLFKTINCKEKGDQIKDVIDFIYMKYSQDPKFNELLKNVKNYRKYGIYLRTDPMTILKCNCEPCE